MTETSQSERERLLDMPVDNIVHSLCRDADRLARAEALLRELSEYFDNYADVVDSDRGVAEVPNEAMEWKQRIDTFLPRGK